MKEKMKLVKDNLVKLCANLLNNNVGKTIKKVVSKTLNIMFIRKPLRKANKFLKLLVQIPLGLIYICIFIGILGSYYVNHTFPDPNRPNVSLAQIQQEEIEAKKTKEEQEKLFAEQQKKETEELAIKKEAEDKAKLEKEEADKKAAEELRATEEAKKQEDQKKIEEEQKAQEAKKVEEERLQQERQAKAEQDASSNNSNSSGTSHNHMKYDNGHTPYEAGYWIADYKKKIYHSDPTCSNMHNPIKITESEAKNRGMRHCKKC